MSSNTYYILLIKKKGTLISMACIFLKHEMTCDTGKRNCRTLWVNLNM